MPSLDHRSICLRATLTNIKSRRGGNLPFRITRYILSVYSSKNLEGVFVRKLPAIGLVGLAAVVLGGTAFAASRSNHVLTVALPDGSTARVDYVGDIAPSVTIEPSARIRGDWAPLSAFAGFDRMIDQMNRAAEAIIRQAQYSAMQPGSGIATAKVAPLGDTPARFVSTTIVSYSNGKATCTRSTETVSQGVGKPPSVRSTIRGNCDPQQSPSPLPHSRSLNHT